jgi:hypothetical protein
LWLQQNQVNARAKLIEPSSWSCFHGVDRWQKECGCTGGADWKEPLFIAMKTLAGWLDQVFHETMDQYLREPWELRHRYIKLMNGQRSLDEICEDLLLQPLDEQAREILGLMLKSQYERQRMFTSCGWFFDEFHRIEPQNNIAYAANAAWLTEKATGKSPDQDVLKLFEKVLSKKTGLRGDTVYTQTLLRAKNET